MIKFALIILLVGIFSTSLFAFCETEPVIETTGKILKELKVKAASGDKEIKSTDWEINLIVKARVKDASWRMKGAKAAVLTVFVDGKYNQDAILFAGAEVFEYQIRTTAASPSRLTDAVFRAPQIYRTLNTPDGDGSGIGAYEYQLQPTAASVSISGRVLMADGIGLMNARGTLTDSSGNARTISSKQKGAFRFEDVNAGALYIITISSRRYTFQTQVVSVTEHLTEMNFTAQE